MKARYLQNTLTRFFFMLRKEGLTYVVIFCFNCLFAIVISSIYKIGNNKSIQFKGKELPLFFHRYNHTWLNERLIEIPIFKSLLDENKGKRILEVGNVLSHYFPVSHKIVDKYEKSENVINQDIVDFHPKKKYDLIISISTLEHVGYEEKPQKPEKIFRAIENLRKLCADNGRIYVSVPVGENPFLDRYIRTGQIQFKPQYNYIRPSPREWKLTEYEKLKNVKHNSPYKFGNAVIIGGINSAP
ncbi:MAG: hypothetical protein P8Y60_18740 [Calditrichota bacterium]